MRNFGVEGKRTEWERRPFKPEMWDFDDALRGEPARRWKYIPQIILAFLGVAVIFVGVVMILTS